MGVNLVQSETSLNAGATTSSGFGEVEKSTQPVFGARLGFLGVDLGKYGRLSYGKQLSTHYNIASYTTDRFNVFGGQSTATYVAGTDGGQSGTARADQTILYHLTFARIFDFGAQGQLRTTDAPQAFNGFGFSFQAKVLPSLQIGGSYNKTYFDHSLRRRHSTEARITGPLEPKAPGATLNGAQTGSGRPEATWRSSPTQQVDLTK
jgi:predicted porin